MTQATIKRVIAAPAERLFDAWTRPELLVQWFGPAGVRCTSAEVDLRIGGAYRLANLIPDGTTVWIEGDFEIVERPTRLVYSWRIGSEPASRVTVTFTADGDRTEVMVVHDRVHSVAASEGHAAGWVGCLDGLERWLA